MKKVSTRTGETMDLNYIKKLIKLLAASAVDEIEIEEEGKRIRISKNSNNIAPASAPPDVVIPHQAPHTGSATSASSSTAGAEPAKKYHEITSPIVGTFYR